MSGRAGILMRGLALPALAAAAVLLGPAAASAAATTLTVTGFADDAGTTPCVVQAGGSASCTSLRDAVNYANGGSAGADPTIALGSGTYPLSGSELDIVAAMTISGLGSQGSGATIIEQTEHLRVIFTTAALTLSGLEVTGGDLIGADGTSGSASGGSASGGGIDTTSPLTLSGVLVTHNQVAGGVGYSGVSPGHGGIASGAGVYAGDGLTMSHSTVSDNTSVGGGGGDATSTNAPGVGGDALPAVVAVGLNMTTSTITANTALAGTGGSASAGAGSTGGTAYGGGLDADGGSIQGSTISNNTSTGGKGGSAGGSQTGGAGGTGEAGGLQETALTVNASTLSDNSAAGGVGGAGSGTGNSAQGGQGGSAEGGGMLDSDGGAPGPTTLVQSVVTGNTVTAGAPGSNLSQFGGNGSGATGGGIADGIVGTSATGDVLTLQQTTVTGNTAIGVTGGEGAGGPGFAANAIGGGLAAVEGASITAVNSTLAGNQAQAPQGPGSTGDTYGGAIHADGTGTSVSLANDTVFGNTAAAAGGSADVKGATLHGGDAATVTLQDTIIAGSAPAGDAVCKLDSGGSIVDHGHNLEDDSPATCGLSSAASDVIGVSPQLPPAPTANGGPTATLAPAAGSPAIGAGGACTNPLSSGAALTTDQRGEPRGPVCDIGSFQTQPIKIAGSPTVGGSAIPGSTVTCATPAVTGDGVRGSDGSIGARAISFAWLRDGAPIAGAVGSTYVIATTDRGHVLACRETATGAYGSGSATSASVQVPAVALPPPPPALKITRLSQSHARWREGKPRKHGAPVGTTFSFTLSGAARVTLSFSTRVTGRRASHHRCVTQTKRNRHAASCKLTVSKGSLSLSGKAGVNRVRFAGHVPGRGTLHRGSYSVVIAAKAGRLSASSRPLSFTIVS